jgi:hypothetical protein
MIMDPEIISVIDSNSVMGTKRYPRWKTCSDPDKFRPELEGVSLTAFLDIGAAAVRNQAECVRVLGGSQSAC